MLYINGKPITQEDLEKFNEELKTGAEKVEKIIISEKGNVLVYTKEFLEID